MIVINAVINNSTELGFEESRLFEESLAQLNIEKYIVVSILPRLLEELEANKNKEILLFSNFPPMFSYMKNGFLKANCDQYDKLAPGWNVPQYAVTAGIFYQVCRQYSFKAIHFITAARREHVTDNHILSITGDIPTTIKRKYDWYKPGMDREVLLRLYLTKKIREALEI